MRLNMTVYSLVHIRRVSNAVLLPCQTARHRNYFMVGERVRFLFTSCEESQTNERVFERVSL